MSNVREGKIDTGVRLLWKKNESKALLVSEATRKVIDLKELPRRLVSELATEPEVQVTETTPLVDPQYAGNVAVMGASAVAGFDVTQAPPVPEQASVEAAPAPETEEVAEIRPISFTVPPIGEPPLQAEVQPVVENADTPVVQEPQVEVVPTTTPEPTPVEAPVVQEQPAVEEVPVVDPVKFAIDQELVTPSKPVVEEQSLQTPQEFSQEEVVDNSKQVSGAYVDVLEEMAKVRERHLRALEKIREELNEKFDALSAKYKQDYDDLVRATERARMSDLDSIKNAVNSQSDLLNSQYVQGNVNAR